MASSPNGGHRYFVRLSAHVAERLRKVQRQATRQSRVRGREVLVAYGYIVQRLTQDPLQFGEPLYRLPAMRMLVLQAVVSPVAVHFGVCEDRPLVFIKGVSLLSR